MTRWEWVSNHPVQNLYVGHKPDRLAIHIPVQQRLRLHHLELTLVSNAHWAFKLFVVWIIAPDCISELSTKKKSSRGKKFAYFQLNFRAALLANNDNMQNIIAQNLLETMVHTCLSTFFYLPFSNRFFPLALIFLAANELIFVWKSIDVQILN